MKHIYNILIITCITCIFNTLKAQSYIGHTVDNYAGVHSVIYNPATSVDSKMKLDVNLISASAFGASDYYGIKLKNLFSSDGIFDSEDDTETFPTNKNNFYVNLDVMGPSVMYNINKKNSIAVISRVRAYGNINKINGELFENYENDFDEDEDFSFENDEFTGTIHAWSEIGVSYGRMIYENGNHKINGGITLKYLQGLGSAYISTYEMKGKYYADAEKLETEGNLTYGVTGGFETDDITYENLGSGFGADLGFIYQWSNNQETTTNSDDEDKQKTTTDYKLKLGVSITDIGSISYDDTEVNNYDLNRTVNSGDYDVDDFEDIYNYTQEIKTVKIKLPTAVHLLADYNITKRLYVSAQADFSVVKQNQSQSSNSLNTVIFSPRFETKWLSVYLPIGFRQYEDFGCGFGLRAGPLTIGSSSIISNTLSDSSKSTDVYVGLKVPLYK